MPFQASGNEEKLPHLPFDYRKVNSLSSVKRCDEAAGFIVNVMNQECRNLFRIV